MVASHAASLRFMHDPRPIAGSEKSRFHGSQFTRKIGCLLSCHLQHPAVERTRVISHRVDSASSSVISGKFSGLLEFALPAMGTKMLFEHAVRLLRMTQRLFCIPPYLAREIVTRCEAIGNISIIEWSNHSGYITLCSDYHLHVLFHALVLLLVSFVLIESPYSERKRRSLDFGLSGKLFSSRSGRWDSLIVILKTTIGAGGVGIQGRPLQGGKWTAWFDIVRYGRGKLSGENE